MAASAVAVESTMTILEALFRDAIAAIAPGVDAPPLVSKAATKAAAPAKKAANKKGAKGAEGAEAAEAEPAPAGPTKGPHHYQCNNALSLGKKAAASVPGWSLTKPPLIAAALIAHVAARGHPLIGSMEAAGAGFINIWLADSAVRTGIQSMLEHGVPRPSVPRKRVVVDFSSPNVAKEMHVGHLRSTIIGECLCRVLEFAQFDVLRTNHVGDWGTQFGMLVAHLKDTHPDYVANPPPIGDLQAFYKEAKKRFDADPEFKARAYAEVVRLQSRQDEPSLAGWRLICDVSRAEFTKIYQRLDVTLTERGESFYHDQLAGAVSAILERAPALPPVGEQPILTFAAPGDVKDEDDDELAPTDAASPDAAAAAGAAAAPAVLVWFPNPKQPNAPLKPLIVRKSDGGYTYATTDFAALRYRMDVQAADWALYVVDSGQSSHLECVFEGGRQMGFFDPAVKRVEHVGFGVVLGEDGKKFKTRSGDTVRLVDLLDEAVARSRELIAAKAAEHGSTLSAAEIDAAASAIGHGCVKYADLSCNRLSDYMFSFDRMLNFNGNTAVYLVYAFARMSSILRKAEDDIGVTVASLRASGAIGELVIDSHPVETALARTLLQFSDVIEHVLVSLLPSELCEYIFELSTVFNDFYTQCKVVDKENATRSRSRLLLVAASVEMMRTLFTLTGIPFVDRL